MHQDSAANIFPLDEIRAFACHIDAFLPSPGKISHSPLLAFNVMKVHLVKSVFITPDLSL